ncbi:MULTISPECIES: hypothetical protein [Comamonas]|uniref:hypothetical protein n=1 Tax=Comamonas TaxID=283 RepID=UPI000621432D|nr:MULTISPECIES: hypothetical protein [Comamonas]KKI12619.1 hypothetical protein XA67_18750 [Comamonas thiooxydans]TYK68655.1 hypothetical protein FSY45_26945 [Comamonas sp. Z1]WKL14397.1 hypothetical protein QYQ99_18595 [Comamonas testosteroni]BCX51761.1 hypothetical protein CTYAZ2_13430 [Comamonas testosteroni]
MLKDVATPDDQDLKGLEAYAGRAWSYSQPRPNLETLASALATPEAKKAEARDLLSTPEAVADYARAERAKWIKSSNIKLDCLPLTQHPKPSRKIPGGLCFMSLDQRFAIVRRPPPIDAT